MNPKLVIKQALVIALNQVLPTQVNKGWMKNGTRFLFEYFWFCLHSILIFATIVHIILLQWVFASYLEELLEEKLFGCRSLIYAIEMLLLY